MSGIGRGIAALLLAGAVAGAAAFAHQLGNEAAPPPLRGAGMAAPHAQPPLVVVAAPAPPLVLPQRAARPGHLLPVLRPAAHPAAVPPVPATGAASVPPSSSATTAPEPAAPVPAPEPAAPVAAPAPAPPAPADRALAIAASVPAQGNENGHGKAKGHDKGRKAHKDGAGDTPVVLAATPLETPASSGTEAPDGAVVAEVLAAPTQVESSDRHGPDDRGNKHDGNGEHGNNGGD